MPQGLVIGVDLDDVLAKHAQGWADFQRDVCGEQISEHDFRDDWAVALPHVPADELEVRKQKFFTQAVVGELEIIEGAQEGVERLTEFGRVVVLTARRETAREPTERWITKNFGSLIDEIYCATYFDHTGTKITKPKADACLEVGVEYLIDDQPRHCLSVSEVGVQALLFGDYRWNQEPQDLPRLVTRVSNWAAVQEYFDATS